jgi:hypothetical protein
MIIQDYLYNIIVPVYLYKITTQDYVYMIAVELYLNIGLTNQLKLQVQFNFKLQEN